MCHCETLRGLFTQLQMNYVTVSVIILYGNRETRITADHLCVCGCCGSSVRTVHCSSTTARLRRLEKNLLPYQFVCSKSNVPCPETEPHPRTYYSNGTYQEVSEEHLIGRDLWLEYGWSWLHRNFIFGRASDLYLCLYNQLFALFHHVLSF